MCGLMLFSLAYVDAWDDTHLFQNIVLIFTRGFEIPKAVGIVQNITIVVICFVCKHVWVHPFGK